MNGASTPIRPTPRRAELTAAAFGTYCRSSTALSTRSRVRGLTRPGRLMTCETVEMLTPARAATS